MLLLNLLLYALLVLNQLLYVLLLHALLLFNLLYALLVLNLLLYVLLHHAPLLSTCCSTSCSSMPCWGSSGGVDGCRLATPPKLLSLPILAGGLPKMQIMLDCNI